MDICTVTDIIRILLGSQGTRDVRGIQNGLERLELHTEFLSEDPEGRGHLGYLAVDERIILIWNLVK
jgi:hypothetical protein